MLLPATCSPRAALEQRRLCSVRVRAGRCSGPGAGGCQRAGEVRARLGRPAAVAAAVLASRMLRDRAAQSSPTRAAASGARACWQCSWQCRRGSLPDRQPSLRTLSLPAGARQTPCFCRWRRWNKSSGRWPTQPPRSSDGTPRQQLRLNRAAARRQGVLAAAPRAALQHRRGTGCLCFAQNANFATI